MATNPAPPDWTTIVTAVAAAIQAVGAIAVAILTMLLVRFTRRYVNTTQDQLDELKTERTAVAKDTERQLQELEQGRTTSLRPYVHVEQIYTGSKSKFAVGGPDLGDQYLEGLQLFGKLINVGPGAALDIRAYVTHKHLNFGLQFDVLVPVLKPGETTDEFQLPRVETSQPLQPGTEWPHEVGLRLEYRDLFDRWWKTTAKLSLGVAIEGRGELRFQDVRLLSETERATLIDKAYIQTNAIMSELLKNNLDVGEVQR
jgi:hypothetical protein